MVLPAHLEELELFDVGDVDFVGALEDEFVDALLLFDELLFYLGLVVLELALVIDFHFLLQVEEELLLFDLGFRLLGKFVGEYFHRRDPVPLHLLQRADAETGERQPEEIELEDLRLLRHLVTRNFRLVDFQQRTVPGQPFDFLDVVGVFGLLDSAHESDEVVVGFSWVRGGVRS